MFFILAPPTFLWLKDAERRERRMMKKEVDHVDRARHNPISVVRLSARLLL